MYGDAAPWNSGSRGREDSFQEQSFTIEDDDFGPRSEPLEVQLRMASRLHERRMARRQERGHACEEECPNAELACLVRGAVHAARAEVASHCAARRAQRRLDF